MNTRDAVSRALGLAQEIRAQSSPIKEPHPAEMAALILSATIFQTMDWIEEKLEQIWHAIPEGPSR